MICPHCGVEHFPEPAGDTEGPRGDGGCPYGGAPFPRLRAGHDELYFGRWRRADAGPFDLRRAFNRLKRLLDEIDAALDEEDLPASRKDLVKAREALRTAVLREGDQEAFMHTDHALSYAHRVIGDLLHEKGAPPHAPVDFAAWFDAAEVPFREDW